MLCSQFVQDEIKLIEDRLNLTLGCKLEENSYTGIEYQPTARLLFTPDRRHTVWGAVSRAVRMPGYEEHEGLFATSPPAAGSPIFGRITGNDGMQSETLWAYELGYRTQATDKFSYDIATFYNVYGGLSTTVVTGSPVPDPSLPPHYLLLPLTFVNGTSADTYGVELATNWSISDHWRVTTQYTFLRIVTSPVTATDDGGSPKHQVYMRSSWDLRENVDFDLTLRYVDCLTGYDVPSYVTMDARLAWRPRKHLEFAVVGQNLLQSYHQEFGTVPLPGYEVTYVPRGVYGTVTWRY
jgi:iron complex outermembrane receptor protein